MDTINENESSARDGAPAHSVSADSRTGAHASIPCSNTGRKINQDQTVICGETKPLDQDDHSEWVEVVTGRKNSWVVRHPIPDESALSRVALIDWLAFTLTPPMQIAMVGRIDGCGDAGFRWMCGELVRLFHVDANSIEMQKTGGSGYKHRARFPGGQILWGGANQRGTINVSITGEGCARIEEWSIIATWLENQQAKLKRVDLAYDDYDGKILNIDTLRQWYEAGEFGAGGRKPEAQLVDDLGSGKGSTFYVGNRKNGKLFRGYEKGKQLGDPESPWVRAECEWHDKSRLLPYDMLTRPGQYLAGAYPALRFLSIEQSKVKTVFRGGKIVFDRAMYNLKQQGGKLINLALKVFGGDYAEVVEQLRRDGLPKRIDPFSYHISQAPEALAHPFGMMQNYAN